MELCDLDLETYIRKAWPADLVGKSRYFASKEYDMSVVWNIMADITCGLNFIHSLGEVHRDLKPSNGTH